MSVLRRGGESTEDRVVLRRESPGDWAYSPSQRELLLGNGKALKRWDLVGGL
jgi:hypothetical protein